MAEMMSPDQQERDPRLPSIEELMGLQRPLTPAKGRMPQGAPPAAMSAPAPPQSRPEEMGTTGATSGSTGNTSGLDASRMPDAIRSIVNAPAARPVSGDQQRQAERQQASSQLMRQMMQADQNSSALSAQRAALPPLSPYGADNKVQKQYRPGIGSRIARGVGDFFAGGIPGAIEGAVNPNAPGYYGKGAINDRYGRDVAQRGAQVANLDEQMKQQDKLSQALKDSYGKVNSAEAADARIGVATQRANTAEETLRERTDEFGRKQTEVEAKDRALEDARKELNEIRQQLADTRDRQGDRANDLRQQNLTNQASLLQTRIALMEAQARAADARADKDNRTPAGKSGKAIPAGTAKAISDAKDNAFNEAKRTLDTGRDAKGKAVFGPNYTSLKGNMGAYLQTLEQAQQKYEDAISAATGQPVEHFDVRSHIDSNGNWINTPNAAPQASAPQPASNKPAANTSKAPAEKTFRDASGNTIKAVVRNGKWVNKATGAAL